jgi:hypothetical protein
MKLEELGPVHSQIQGDASKKTEQTKGTCSKLYCHIVPFFLFLSETDEEPADYKWCSLL